ncbi:MAG: PD-(D/E)XK nuclease family protein [Syntrophomonadaceae bacterium]|nr:PD-(D/E)XK nuclease family protein [Syntrophomonadaceae bacterium]MDD3022516.1 PD-(D/E)XK nuclease family protein [Syntrophomonadaceae bacterium]
MAKIPLEDFTTEILVGILQKNKEILNEFVNQVLKIDGASFKIGSQKKYTLPDDVNCIIDIVIENDSLICFLENKVNSGEGERQLERYSRVLIGLKTEAPKNSYLRYCTKYNDPKEITDIDFNQFRWSDVYKFLECHQENELIGEFLEFLEEYNMGSVKRFQTHDLLTMNNINSTIAKMDECLDIVKPKLVERFGKTSSNNDRIKRLYSHEQYAIWTTTGVIGAGDSDVLVGFYLNDEEGNSEPGLLVRLFIDERNSEYKHVKEETSKFFEGQDAFDFYDDEDGEYACWYEKSLSDFLSSENQLEEICKWFNEKIDKIYALQDLTSLTWNKA